MSEIKELTGNEIENIISFWEGSGQNDEWCNAWISICNACVDKGGLISDADKDTFWRLKYKYGKKILRMIAKRAKTPNDLKERKESKE